MCLIHEALYSSDLGDVCQQRAHMIEQRVDRFLGDCRVRHGLLLGAHMIDVEKLVRFY